MKMRHLGSSGILVSEIGFGTIPILSGNVPVLPDYYNLDKRTAVEVMNYAFSLGCNLYDTAIVPEYGDAEIKLGEFAAQADREKIILSDKARFFDGDALYQAVCQSCQNLKSYVDIYFVHQVDSENVEQTFGKYGAIDALCELKAEGKIRFTGVASHYYDILKRGAADSRVDVLQGSGNIFERGMLNRMEQEAAFQSKGFLCNKVYAAGILPGFFSPEVLLAGVLSYPISSALIGLGTFEEVEKAMGVAMTSYTRPSFSSVIARLERDFYPIFCDRCQRCRCI